MSIGIGRRKRAAPSFGKFIVRWLCWKKVRARLASWDMSVARAAIIVANAVRDKHQRSLFDGHLGYGVQDPDEFENES